ncbi:S-adenosyl-L-methionine-dependent methyltransferase [Fennellomyces sp. T-0311]|nr:S-adenosyl-L-methionine-dependent methyltransferase [Fennellomyces sp. T-0311]
MGSNESKLSNERHTESKTHDNEGRGVRFHRRTHSKEYKKHADPQVEPVQQSSSNINNYIQASRRPSLRKNRHSTGILSMIKHPQASMRKSFSSGSDSTASTDTAKSITTSKLEELSAEAGSAAMISAVANAVAATNSRTPSMGSRTSSFPSSNGGSVSTQVAVHNEPKNATFLHPPEIPCIHERSPSPTLQSEPDDKTQRTGERLLKELYLLPEADAQRRKERDRQHYLLKYVWRANFKVPLQSPTLIVNWCCGTGIWAMEMAQQFPHSQVIGMDFQSATLSSLGRSLSNLSFKNIIVGQGTTGLETLQDNTVDYLMMRDVWLVNSPGYKWLETLVQVFRVLKPGGWVEVYEQDLLVRSPGPHLAVSNQWYKHLFEAVGIKHHLIDEISSFFPKIGFTALDEREVELPLGEWPTVPAMKETGYLFKDLMIRRFRTIAPWLCEFNNITLNDINDNVEKWAAECEEYKASMCWRYWAAQKPLSQEKAGLSA